MQGILSTLTILAGFLSVASPAMATTWQCNHTGSRRSVSIVSHDDPTDESAGIRGCIKLQKRASNHNKGGYVRECLWNAYTGEAVICYYTKPWPNIVGACLKGGGCPLDMEKWQLPRAE